MVAILLLAEITLAYTNLRNLKGHVIAFQHQAWT